MSTTFPPSRCAETHPAGRGPPGLEELLVKHRHAEGEAGAVVDKASFDLAEDAPVVPLVFRVSTCSLKAVARAGSTQLAHI